MEQAGRSMENGIAGLSSSSSVTAISEASAVNVKVDVAVKLLN